MEMIDVFSFYIGGIIGIILGVCGFYIRYRHYITKTIDDIAYALKDGRLEFKEVLFYC
jgi:hypothetical protein